MVGPGEHPVHRQDPRRHQLRRLEPRPVLGIPELRFLHRRRWLEEGHYPRVGSGRSPSPPHCSSGLDRGCNPGHGGGDQQPNRVGDADRRGIQACRQQVACSSARTAPGLLCHDPVLAGLAITTLAYRGPVGPCRDDGRERGAQTPTWACGRRTSGWRFCRARRGPAESRVWLGPGERVAPEQVAPVPDTRQGPGGEVPHLGVGLRWRPARRRQVRLRSRCPDPAPHDLV